MHAPLLSFLCLWREKIYQVLFEMDEALKGNGDYSDGDTITADIYETWLEAI